MPNENVQNSRVTIAGIGDDVEYLPESTRRLLESAQLVIGPERVLARIPAGNAEQFAMSTDLSAVVQRINAAADQNVLVLASGDPLFFGIANYLCDRLGKESCEVVPHVSSMQLAFARVKESWDEAYLGNLANQSLSAVVERIRISEKVGLFTTEDRSPKNVAKALLDEGLDYFRVYVCENLGGRNEVVTQGTVAEIAEMDFGPLNVMILVRHPNVATPPRRQTERRLFGNSDEAFLQSRPHRGLLTPAEVRILALGHLNVHRQSIVWDIGAGSGAVSVEAAQIAPEGKVFAIEPELEDCALIHDNAKKFEVSNVQVVQGRAPEAFESLPDPDCIFIGGIGREVAGVVTQAFSRLRPKGSLVVNVASIERVSSVTNCLRKLVPHVGLLMVNLARGTHQLENIRFESLNPSFLIFVSKDKE